MIYVSIWSTAWDFHRQVYHHDTGQVADIHGHVTWQDISTPGAVPTLRYCETGVLQLDAYTCRATQTHIYTFPSQTVAEIYFRDGRFFYTLDLTTGHCTTHHPCGDDLYEGAFEAVSETLYQHIWRVTGPDKNYTSHTTFSRSRNGI